jgi:hypothetical protein
MNDPDPRHASDGFDQDAIFADIVAHLNDDEAEPERASIPWVEGAATDREGTDEASADQPPGEDRSHIDQPPVQPVPNDPLPLPTPQIWRAHEVGDDEEHFEPQPVAPLPVGDLQFWAIIAGMGGGPLLLLYLVLFNREAGGLWILTAIAMSVGGFLLLVSRMPGNQDGDDGARL